MSGANSDESPEPTSPEAVKETPATKHGGCLLGCVVLFPILYLLSLPFFVMAMNFFLRRGMADAAETLSLVGTYFYYPVEWLYQRSPLFKDALDAYLQLFGDWLNV